MFGSMGILPPSKALLVSPTMIILLDRNSLASIDHITKFAILVPNHCEPSTKIDGNSSKAITEIPQEKKVEWHPNQCYFTVIQHHNKHYL